MLQIGQDTLALVALDGETVFPQREVGMPGTVYMSLSLQRSNGVFPCHLSLYVLLKLT